MFSRFTSWIKKSVPNYPDPREETPDQAKKRLHHLERKARSARHAIECVYELPDLSPWDPKIEKWTQSTVHYLMKDEQVQELIAQNWSSPEDIREATTQAVHDYFRAFVLFHAMKQEPPARPEHPRYESPQARNQLYHLYSNRIANAVEARFIAHRMDALDAHKMNHKIIKSVIDSAHAVIDEDVHITPPQGRPKTELMGIEQVDQLRDFERRHVQALRAALYPEEHQQPQPRRY